MDAPFGKCGKARELFRRDLKRGKSRRSRGPDSASERSSRGGARSARGETPRPQSAFVLYVEGPRDLQILGAWAKRLDPALARCIEEKAVILGGKQPARAISDFQKRVGEQEGFSGLMVLDRDEQGHSDHDDVRSAGSRAGLEVFVWSLRHIESYLLVPGVIRRVLRLDPADRRVEELILHQEAAEASRGSSGVGSGGLAERSVHAKRILGANGALAEVFGTELKAGELARAMRREDLHDDVLHLFERVRALSGLAESGPEVEVIVRKPRRSPGATASASEPASGPVALPPGKAEDPDPAEGDRSS